MNIISYAGGVQTTALLVQTAQGKVENPATHAVFADTGSELQDTLDHIANIMEPYGRKHGIPLVTVRSKLGALHKFVIEKQKVPIPMYGDRGGILYRRCTSRWKIDEVRRWLRRQGAKKAIVQIGISTDEAHRMSDSPLKWITHSHPLVDMRLSRQDCMNIIRDAGLPVPPRSACWMCPFRKHDGWINMKIQRPAEFEKAVAFEKHLDGLFIPKSRHPLDQAVGEQCSMFDDDECGGYCWT